MVDIFFLVRVATLVPAQIKNQYSVNKIQNNKHQIFCLYDTEQENQNLCLYDTDGQDLKINI